MRAGGGALRWVLGVLAVAALALVLALPPWLREEAGRRLAERGVPARVGSVGVELARPALVLGEVALGEPGAPAVVLERLVLSVDPRALLEGRIRIRGVGLDGARVVPAALPGLARSLAAARLPVGEPLRGPIAVRDLELRARADAASPAMLVRRLEVADPAALARGERSAVALSARAGRGRLELEGTLSLAAGDPLLDARLDADSMPASALLGAAGLGGGEARTAGVVDATGTLRAWAPGDSGAARLALDARASVAGLGASGASLSLERLDARADGRLEVEWGAAPGARFVGTLRAAAGNVAGVRVGTARVEVRIEDLVYEGLLTFGPGAEARGALRVESVVAATGPPDGPRLAASAVTGELGAPPGAGAGTGAVATRLRADEVRLAAGGWRARLDGPGAAGVSLGAGAAPRADELRVPRVEVSVDAWPGPVQVDDLRLAEASLGGAGAELVAGRLEAGRVEAPLDGGRRVVLGRLALERVAAGSGRDSLSAARASAGRVELATGAGALRAARMRAGDLVLGADGRWSARHAGAATLESYVDARLRWRVDNAAGARLERPAGAPATRAARLSADRVLWRDPGGTTLEVLAGGMDGVETVGALGGARAARVAAQAVLWNDTAGHLARATGLALGAAGWAAADGLSARDVDLETLRVDAGPGLRVEAERWSGQGFGIDPAGGFELGGATVGRLRVREGAAEWRFEDLAARSAALSPTGALALGAPSARIATREQSGAATVRAGGPRVVGRLEAVFGEPAPRLSVPRLEADRLVVDGLEPGRLQLEDVESAALRWTRAAGLAGERLRAERLVVAAGTDHSLVLDAPSLSGYVWPAGGGPVPGFEVAEAARVRGADASALPLEVAGLRAENAVPAGEGAGPAIRVGRVRLGVAHATDRAGLRRALVASASVRDLRVDGSGVGWAEAVLEGLRLEHRREGSPRPAVLEARETRIGAASLADGTLALATVRLEGAAGEMGFDAEGRWLGPALPRSDPGGSGRALRIEALRVAPDARLRLFDTGIEPWFSTELSPFAFELEGFDSRDPGRRAVFRSTATVDRFASLALEGTAVPAGGGFDVEVSGRLGGLDLATLSAYAERELDTVIRRGFGDGEFHLEVASARVRGEVTLELRDLEVAPARPGPAGELSLAASLMMLKDPQGTVRLELPVEGSTEAPRFGLPAGLVTSLTRVARSTLAITLRPVGILLDAGGGLLSALGAGRAAAEVPFAPGSTDLSADARARLSLLAERMREHPAMRARVCAPVLSAEAGTAAGRTPGALAAARDEVVRRYLREEGGIPAQRLVPCAPAADDAPGAEPRVEIEVLAAGTVAPPAGR